ncbi:xyloglucan endotransglucosylase/hydrolase 2-like [Ipomoea triloba]|uniref:xyloglucan endotransglucosylase/hydrolase 2-like n=1 Tax=Ipomoea triloba TaxID=35885 RepID=UPI00125D5BA5|nr:xyloglucan endotransglucosylase/hydrolase 2-like [Ipomoea triloba]
MRGFSRMLELLVMVALSCSLASSYAGDFYQDFDMTWGGNGTKISNGGQLLSLSLDTTSGSAFRSKKDFLFGRVEMEMKLVPGNSAGTVTAFYLSAQGPTHDEIDFEFLGNVTGEPYVLHTNVITQGRGGREQQFYLWFDPTKNFHTYTIVWKPQHIIFLVDKMPIRVFKNDEEIGVPFPKNQTMKVYSSIWNAEAWATRSGEEKIDWSYAPFTAHCRNFQAKTFPTSHQFSNGEWESQELDDHGKSRLKWIQKKFMVYNYCTDFKRFPMGIPGECRVPMF